MNSIKERDYEGLKKSQDFQLTYNKGKYIVTKQIVVYYRKNSLEKSRIGFSVGKKVGKSVARSRIKRLMKESVRLNFKPYKDSYDLVFVARKGFAPEGYAEVEKTIRYLLRKII